MGCSAMGCGSSDPSVRRVPGSDPGHWRRLPAAAGCAERPDRAARNAPGATPLPGCGNDGQAAQDVPPVFEVEGAQYVMLPPQLAGIPEMRLGTKLAYLAQHRDEIVAALNLLITGIQVGEHRPLPPVAVRHWGFAHSLPSEAIQRALCHMSRLGVFFGVFSKRETSVSHAARVFDRSWIHFEDRSSPVQVERPDRLCHPRRLG